MKNKSNLLFLIFLLFSVFYTCSNFISIYFDKLHIFYGYYNTPIITLINVTSTLINIFLIILLVQGFQSSTKEENSFRKYIFLSLKIFLIFLIWLELLYGASIYYGEIRDKQAVWFSINNFGIIGSIFISFSFFEIKKRNKLIKYILILITIIFFHLIIVYYYNSCLRLFY